jgi:hypothetical protein
LVDMLARAGVGKLTLIDPEDFSAENVGRHILDCRSIGKSKAYELAQHVSLVNPSCYVTALQEKFDIRPERPGSHSLRGGQLRMLLAGEQLCNPPWDSGGFRRRLGRGFGGEILYMVPGKTDCYECYAGFRQHVEIPPDARKYTDPTFDDTRVPGQAGLWSNVLIVAAMQFQVVLGLLGLRGTIDHEHWSGS